MITYYSMATSQGNTEPQHGNQMSAQMVGAGFHFDLHFTGSFLKNQSVSSVLPFETTPSMQTTAVTRVYPHRLASPLPSMTEQSETTSEEYPLDLVGLTIHGNGDL